MIELEYKKQVSKALILLLVVLSVSTVVGIFSKTGKIRSANPNEPIPSISLTGHGEVQAVPDIANVSFTVESSLATQKASSDEVNTKTKKVIEFLKSAGVAEKDIKTEGYSSYPKYSAATPCPTYYYEGMPACKNDSKIIGFTVSQSVTVKVRNVDDTSKIIDGINAIGVMNMSGPTFAIDKEDVLKADARKKAIEDAKAKAEVLAKQLGVRLVRITSFNENAGGYYPMYASGAMMMKDSAVSAPVPSELPKGENTIISDVNLTYEIR